MKEKMKTYKCPQCNFPRVKRESVGIWKCRKCGFTYTGGAYTPATKLGLIARRSAKRTAIEEASKATAEQEAT